MRKNSEYTCLETHWTLPELKFQLEVAASREVVAVQVSQNSAHVLGKTYLVGRFCTKQKAPGSDRRSRVVVFVRALFRGCSLLLIICALTET